VEGKFKMRNFKFERKGILFLVVVLCLATGLSVFLMHYRFAVSFDEVNYLKLAASGSTKGFSNVLHPFWSPFFPLCVALFSKVIPNVELAGRLFSILCGVLIIIPIFLFTKFYFNQKVARYAVLLLAFFPSLAFINTAVMSESLYSLLITSGMIVGWITLRKQSWFLGIAVGLLIGFAYLTRPEGIGFLIVFVGVSIFLSISMILKKKGVYRLLWIPLMAIVGFSFAAAPYLVYLHKATGEWTISAKRKSLHEGEVFALAERTESFQDVFRTLSEDNTQVPIDQIYHIGNFLQAERQRGKPLVEISPSVFLKKYVKNLYQILNYVIPQVLTTTIFILMILGLLGEAWSKERTLRELYFLVCVGFFWFIVIPLFHINERYFLPFLPICFMWVGNGLDTLIFWLSKTLKKSVHLTRKISYDELAKGIVLFFILGAVFLPELGKVMIRDRWSDDYFADPIEQRTAGLWLKEHTSSTPIIMSRNHTVDFYAENYNIAESVTIPQNDLNRVLSYAKYRGVDYIVLNERYKKDFPLIAHLLEEKDIPNDLKLVYTDQDKSKLRTVIYQLVKD